jgi:hypothetical protein
MIRTTCPVSARVYLGIEYAEFDYHIPISLCYNFINVL